MTELKFFHPDDLQKVIGYKFKDPAYLQEALTHKSANHKKGKESKINYERLEFMGDRVLGLVIAEELLKAFPKESEGQISRRFAALVSQDSLADVGEDLQLAEYIVAANAEEGGNISMVTSSIVADVAEALIAAIFYDGGLDKARRFIRKHWDQQIKEKEKPPKDAKTMLQEWAQANNKSLPIYRITDKKGPDHSPIFVITLDLAGVPVLTAHGTSKRAAEQEVARKALRFLNEQLPE